MPFRHADARRAYQREYYRLRNRDRYRRWRHAGVCGVCGAASGRFARCLRHRVLAARRKRQARGRA